MKKILFNVANLGATEVLSREELKKVLGGITTAAGSGSELRCKVTQACKLFVRELGLVVDGTCKEIPFQGITQCGCVNGEHVSDPSVQSEACSYWQ